VSSMNISYGASYMEDTAAWTAGFTFFSHFPHKIITFSMYS